MTIDIQNEEPGFERDENELPEDQDGGNPNTLEDGPLPEDEEAGDETLEEAQEDAAEQRSEGGYQ